MPNKNLVQPDYILINDRQVFYKIRKSVRAKRLQMRIVNSALELIVPQRISIEEGKRFLHQRRTWIEKHLYLLTPKPKQFFFFGKEIKIQHSFHLFNNKHSFKLKNDVLYIESPADANFTKEELFSVYRKHIAKKRLPARTFELAEKFGFKIKRVSVRSQKSRWGSCSSKGTISLNDKLIEYKQEVIDYVIIHELCHLVHMNHSQKFWQLVGRFCPNYKAYKRILKQK